MKQYKVAFYEAFAEEAEKLKSFVPDDWECFFTDETIQKAGAADPPAQVVSIRTQSEIPENWAGKLSGIVSRSTGYDHVRAYLEKTGAEIPAAFLPTYCARAVAEQALWMFGMLLRKAPLQQKQMTAFHRDGLTGREIAGKTLLVAGVGNIGKEVVDVGVGLSMRVLGVDINPSEEMAGRNGFEYVSLGEGLKQADVAVSALPLTDLTRGMFGSENLSKMQAGGIFVNVSRGEVSPPSDLLGLLNSGHLAGVGLDVYDFEPSLALVLRENGKLEDIENPQAVKQVRAVLELMKHERAVLTPHNAFNTIEAVGRKSEQTVENLKHFFEKGNFLTPVPGKPPY